MTAPAIDYNPFDPAVIANPYPHYARLRAESPVYWCEQFGGFWVITRYHDVVEVLRNTADFSSTWGPGPMKTISPANSLLSSDPPVHTFMRSMAASAFTPKMVAQLESRIEAIADELIDTFADHDEVDLVQEFAYPLPVIVIAEILGVPPKDRAIFKSWSDDIVAAIGGLMDASKARKEFTEYFLEAIHERQLRPRDDMVTRLISPGPDGRSLTTDEALGFCQALLVAGNETTTSLIGNLFQSLCTFPEERRRLYADPSLVHTAVEESLRFEAPNQGLYRHTTRDLEFRGVRMKAGSKVLVSFASPGRDAEVFPDPDHFDVGRTPNRHLAYGMGIHTCIGAPLASLEGRVALRSILKRFADFELDTSKPAPAYVPIFFIRGITSLPLRMKRR